MDFHANGYHDGCPACIITATMPPSLFSSTILYIFGHRHGWRTTTASPSVDIWFSASPNRSKWGPTARALWRGGLHIRVFSTTFNPDERSDKQDLSSREGAQTRLTSTWLYDVMHTSILIPYHQIDNCIKNWSVPLVTLINHYWQWNPPLNHIHYCTDIYSPTQLRPDPGCGYRQRTISAMGNCMHVRIECSYLTDN